LIRRWALKVVRWTFALPPQENVERSTSNSESLREQAPNIECRRHSCRDRARKHQSFGIVYWRFCFGFSL